MIKSIYDRGQAILAKLSNSEGILHSMYRGLIKNKMNIACKYCFLICLGLFIVQPTFAQDNDPTAVCANELDNDPNNDDIDDDNDGLIEICDLEGLNAVRYQLDGTGYKTTEGATVIRTGCPSGGCTGFELIRSLDFMDNNSYRILASTATYTVSDYNDSSDTGWQPIGDSLSNAFSATFEGNGFSISNLQINRKSSDVGLFGINAGTIRNLGLLEIQVQGSEEVGGLAGKTEVAALIINSYVHGSILGNNVVGGLCGANSGRIINSYANADVRGEDYIGGLAGRSQGDNNPQTISEIVNSYAAGTVHSLLEGETQARVGGLLGYLSNDAMVENSYSIAMVSIVDSGLEVSGLIGTAEGMPTVVDSYWDTVMSGRTNSLGGGTAMTTAQLQMPTMADGIYAEWHPDDWDFGNMQDYPALRYNDVDDIDACNTDVGTVLPRCGILLSGQPVRNKGLSTLFFVRDGIELDNTRLFGNRPFFYLSFDYDVTIPYADEIQLRPYANDDTATILITQAGDTQNTDYFAGKRSGDLSRGIPLPNDNMPTTLSIVVMGAEPTTYHIVVRTLIPDEDITLGISDLKDGDIVSEGQSINAQVGGGNSLYYYSFAQDGIALVQGESTTSVLSFSIPEDLDFAEDATTRRIVYTILADNGRNQVDEELELIVTKTNNEDPRLELNVNREALSLSHDANDPDGLGSYIYRWQRRDEDEGEWTDISRTDRYGLPSNSTATIRYRVFVNYIDGQGHSDDYLVGPFPANIDADEDGLIDIYYLEDLDVVRYQSNGSGYSLRSDVVVKITQGCPMAVCRGYELLRDLDFSSTQSYVDGYVDVGAVRSQWTVDDFSTNDGSDVGWEPINSLSSIFEGNGYSISNLQINRDNTNDVALFRVNARSTLNSRNSGTIRNLRLSKITVEGRSNVGGLVASNQGNIINSYVDDSYASDDRGVIGNGNGTGILVGINTRNGLIVNAYVHGDVSGNNNVGGLVGDNAGRIFNSYAVVAVSGTVSTTDGLGGLVGKSEGSIAEIVNGYTVGTVHRRSGTLNYMGGLTGYLFETEVKNSYARVEISDSDSSSIDKNLIGTRPLSSISDSYWEIGDQTNTNRGGEPKTAAELQMPTMPGIVAGDIYHGWESADWDFGNNTSYPALRYNGVSGINACDTDPETALPHCGILLPAQPIRDKGLNALLFVRNGAELDTTEAFGSLPSFSSSFDHDVTIPYTTEIQLRPYSINDAATIAITRAGDMPSTDYFAGKRSSDLSDSILLPRENVPTTLTVVVMDASPTSYNFVIRRTVPDADVTVDIIAPSPGTTVSEGGIITASIGGANEAYYYSLQNAASVVQGQGSGATLNARIPKDLSFAPGATMQSIVLTLLVGNGRNEVSDTIELTVVKVDDGEPQLRLSLSPMALSVVSVVDDPDGAGTFTYEWQQRDETDSGWLPISNDPSYSVPDNSPSTIRYRVVVDHTDSQGYMETYRIGPFPINIDGDDDGLIDVYYLEDLNAARNRLDGSGYSIGRIGDNITADRITLGCPGGGCIGYELLRDLDFNTTRSYIDATAVQGQTTIQDQWMVDDFADAADTGWLPIGSVVNPFDSIFDGNDYTISNLQMNRDDIRGAGNDADIALFAALSGNARIENVGLVDVAIEGRGDTSSLVAENKGAIVNSYVQRGEVMGTQHNLGGLVAVNDRDTALWLARS